MTKMLLADFCIGKNRFSALNLITIMILNMFQLKIIKFHFSSFLCTLLFHSKAFKGMNPPQKNYLLSLYDHVREIAYLISEFEGKNKGK